MTDQTIPLAILGSLLFTLIGPLGVIPTFAAVVGSADPGLRVRIAVTAVATAAAALALAVLVGAPAMAAAGTSPSSLIMAAGLILTVTALRNIFGSGGEKNAGRPEPSLALGITPIAVPGMVTPVGVAVVIIFSSYFPGGRTEILSVVGGILLANFAAMMISGWFMRRIGMVPLLILGAVFGVLQAAMGIQFLVSGLMRSALWQ